MFRWLTGLVYGLCWAVPTAWATAALGLDLPVDRAWASSLAVAYAGLLGVAVCVLHALAAWRSALVLGALAIGGVGLWELQLEPRGDGPWRAGQERVAQVTRAGDRITLSNVRSFDYRSASDFDRRWETRTYDLRSLRGADWFLCDASPAGGAAGSGLSHSILSWDFGEDGYLAISIEPRLEPGESYSVVRALFRQYELYYVVGDERDLIRLRTNVRGEDVRLYPLRISAERARTLLTSYLGELELLAGRPRWYNLLALRFGAELRHRRVALAPTRPWDWRVLLGLRLDRLAYELGQIDTSLPFRRTRIQSNITARALAADESGSFSEQIRRGLPGVRRTTPERTRAAECRRGERRCSRPRFEATAERPVRPDSVGPDAGRMR